MGGSSRSARRNQRSTAKRSRCRDPAPQPGRSDPSMSLFCAVVCKAPKRRSFVVCGPAFPQRRRDPTPSRRYLFHSSKAPVVACPRTMDHLGASPQRKKSPSRSDDNLRCAAQCATKRGVQARSAYVAPAYILRFFRRNDPTRCTDLAQDARAMLPA